MSRYKIFQINHYDPKIIGKRKRKIAILYGAMSPLFVLTFLLLDHFLNINFLILTSILLLIFIGFYLILRSKLKTDNRALKIIGDIEFTKTNIVKHIGDSISDYKYESIKIIKLENHIPAIGLHDSNSEYFTYILSIAFSDYHKESFIISDLPVDKSQNLSIVDTLKTLKKLIKTDILIN